MESFKIAKPHKSLNTNFSVGWTYIEVRGVLNVNNNSFVALKINFG